ncbi:uncharacterized protein LOC132615322 [Lycium barbarum]|uniref:uncharacterized protein LOC132615322 n=1 Tax=Lycium barbarum TaxID=112863 RepID=UPI00293EFED7|nr:uncharacterized protein LOC132615322 [Lycium barbarum]
MDRGAEIDNVQSVYLVKYVDGSDPAPTDPIKLGQWKVQDARMMTWILGSIDPIIILNLRPYKTAKAMREYLQKVYNQDNSARRFQLEHEIANYSQGSLSVQDYFSGFQNLWAKFTDIVYAKILAESLSITQAFHEQSNRDQFLMKLRFMFESVGSNLMNRDLYPSLDIQVVNGSNLPITKIGDITPTVKNVFVSSKLSTSLISIGQLVDNNCDVNFSCNGCLVLDRVSGMIIAKRPKVGRLFPIHFSIHPALYFACTSTASKTESIKCAFMDRSTSQKGFICYDPSSNKFRVSRNVVFFENQYFFPIHVESSSVSPPLPTFEDLSPFSKRFKSGFVYERRQSTYPISKLIRHLRLLHNQNLRFLQGLLRLSLLESNGGRTLALKQNNTWDIVSCPSNMRPIGCKWVYSIKLHSDGTLARYKARLVILDNKQEYGVDYEETFVPVAKMTTVRIIISIATSQNWSLHQIDVKNTFLHGDLKEDIYMKPPPSLFASPTLDSKYDLSLFLQKTSTGCVLLLVYVDDIIITGTDSSLITSLQQQHKESFHMKDLGTLTYFLGLEVHYDSLGVFLNQHKYAKDFIALAGLQESFSMDTLLELNVKYHRDEEDLLPDPTLFWQLVGSLNYLTITRPDISFVVQQVS